MRSPPSSLLLAEGGKKEDADARRERMCRHEAGHLLCGYVCGLPVSKYMINSETSVANVECLVSRGCLRETTISDADIAHLSVVAMPCRGELPNSWLSRRPPEARLIYLLALQNCFRRSKDFIGAAKQQDLTRWGVLMSYDIIKKNLTKYEALVWAFKENTSLADCVSIIEATK